MRFRKSWIWTAVYGPGDDDGTGDAAAAEAAKKAAADEAAKKAAEDAAAKKTFTQDEFNKALAEDRRKHKKQVDDAVAQLEALQKSKSLTEKEKNELQGQIEELRSSLMTSEEKAKHDREKLDKTYKEQLGTTQKETEMWRGLFASESTRNSIITSCERHKAVSSEQIMDLLMPKTRIVEALDGEGKVIPGRYIPKVKFQDTKDGNIIELDLTIDEAVKRMKELPDRFGNLFQSDAAGGLGGNQGRGTGGSGGAGTAPPKDPAQYREWRKKQGYAKTRA